MDKSLLIPMVLPQDCILVFDLVHDENQECDCIVISNPSTAKRGYLIDGYSEEEQALLDDFECSDFDEGYLMESMYELPFGMTKDQIIEGITSLGFGYMPGFMKDSKSI